MTGAAIATPAKLDHHERAMQAIHSIERRAEALAHEPRRSAWERACDLAVIDRQLKVLVLAVEAAYRGGER